jgi:hypothetical protein
VHSRQNSGILACDQNRFLLGIRKREREFS